MVLVALRVLDVQAVALLGEAAAGVAALVDLHMRLFAHDATVADGVDRQIALLAFLARQFSAVRGEAEYGLRGEEYAGEAAILPAHGVDAVFHVAGKRLRLAARGALAEIIGIARFTAQLHRAVKALCLRALGDEVGVGLRVVGKRRARERQLHLARGFGEGLRLFRREQAQAVQPVDHCPYRIRFEKGGRGEAEQR